MLAQPRAFRDKWHEMANNSRTPLKPEEARRLAEALRVNLLKRKASKPRAKPAKEKPGARAD